jgi:3-phosphoshikimate 1-carboxyvinyltransferase
LDIIIKQKNSLHGSVTVPGDKSISHRSVMFGAIAKGITEVHGFLLGEDCLSTISCFRKLGITIELQGETVFIHGKGLNGLSAPTEVLDVGNSGTTLRLMSGLLAAQPFTSHLTGDASIQKRPMNRIAVCLRQMGASFECADENNLHAPFTIHGKKLKAIEYTLPVASAQVKSALLLAGLYAEGETVVIEPEPTRNHTEIMLNYMGADITTNGTAIHCRPVSQLYGKRIDIPGDISSAAYFMVAGCICQNAEILLKNVGINPTRSGIIDVLIAMGANITIQNQQTVCGELVGDILVRSSALSGTVVEGSLIPRLIDEIPILAVAACFAKGTTVIRDAAELKVKESNRIHTVVTELKKFGASIEETEDGMVIYGGKPLAGCTVETYHDHRIAMAMAVAGIMADGETIITNAQCANISYPDFYESLLQL